MTQLVFERCLHGMLKGSCAFCTPPRKARVPARSEKRTPHGKDAGLLDLPKHGIAVVHTKARAHALIVIAGFDPSVDFVHFDGHPFLWAVEAVVDRLPGLKIVQVIPKMLDRFRGAARDLCTARGIQVVGGHIRPDLAWEDDRVGNPFFDEQRRFMLAMGPEQRALFDELLALGFDAAKMAARYFCLSGEDYTPMRCLAEEYGFANGAVSSVSYTILGILRYLDDSFEVGEVSQRRAEGLRDRVTRLRPLLTSAEYRQRIIRELGVPGLAASFPLARVEVFGALLAASRDGRLSVLQREHPRDHEAVSLRFGLDRLNEPTYRKLLEVGEMMGGITRERARQLEERALERLWIREEA